MFNKLINLANYLDKSGFRREADKISLLIKVAGKLTDAINTYPEFEQEIRKLYAGVRPGYFNWALEELVDGNATSDELIPILDRFQRVRDNLERKDLYQYPAINILRKAVDKYGQTDAELRVEKRNKKSEETDFVYKSDNFIVIWPKTEFASCEWGKNTKWCVSAKESNMYDNYSNDNVFLYFIINKNLSDKDKYRRIAIPTKGNLGILKTEVRDALDENISMEEVMRATGDEYNLILNAILDHADNTNFTDNVSDHAKEAAIKIENSEDISVQELANILALIGDSDTGNTYWTNLIMSALPTHPTLVSVILQSRPDNKHNLKYEIESLLEYTYSEENEKNSSDLATLGLDLYLIDRYGDNVGNSLKLQYLNKFFSEDVSVLKSVFPKMLKHLLPFKKGQQEMINFISNDLHIGEFSLIVEAIEDNELIYLYSLEELTSRDVDVLTELGKAAVDRGLIDQEDFRAKVNEWDRNYSDIGYGEEYYA